MKKFSLMGLVAYLLATSDLHSMCVERESEMKYERDRAGRGEDDQLRAGRECPRTS